MSPADRGRLAPPQALVLGILHGPAELLPISSSAHVEALPWLLGWSYHDLDEDLRKSFEVVLHAGTAAGLIVSSRAEIGAALRHLDKRRLAALVLSAAPPALAGLVLERPIEQRLGTPATIAAGLLVGSLLMARADGSDGSRPCQEAGALDGLWLGLAQAGALVPGVSRAGATVAAARLRGFAPADAERFSRLVGLPVIGGAMALRAVRMGQRPGGRDGTALALGAAASLVSTIVSAKLMRGNRRGDSLWPYIAYRAGIAAIIAAKLRA
jgi:undecaprenyl-diphosphatase